MRRRTYFSWPRPKDSTTRKRRRIRAISCVWPCTHFRPCLRWGIGEFQEEERDPSWGWSVTSSCVGSGFELATSPHGGALQTFTSLEIEA